MRRRDALIGGAAAAALGLSAQAQEEAEAIAQETLNALAGEGAAEDVEAENGAELDAEAEAQNVEVDLDELYRPTTVEVRADMPAGEIHVDPNIFMLYWTVGDGKAIRYGVGVGRPGLYESGEFYVGAKKEWPSWTPTPDMIRRQPEKYGRYRDGLPGGLSNPLGARALYLFTPGKGDTFLRIHGTNEPWTIGSEVSNGCARLVNDYIMDLYPRVPIDTRVVLYPKSA